LYAFLIFLGNWGKTINTGEDNVAHTIHVTALPTEENDFLWKEWRVCSFKDFCQKYGNICFLIMPL
jgi:hypothetical protein